MNPLGADSITLGAPLVGCQGENATASPMLLSEILKRDIAFMKRNHLLLAHIFSIRYILILTLSHISEVSIVWFSAIIDFSPNDSLLLSLPNSQRPGFSRRHTRLSL